MQAGPTADRERARKVARTGAVIRLLRPAHWLKNGFVLAALVFSRSFHDPARVRAALWAAAAFSPAASAVYIFNDLRDAASDRRHPHKRRRPLAAERALRGQPLRPLRGAPNWRGLKPPAPATSTPAR
jgi:4-hydroxybenzoate polyprenyltransferase